MVQQTIKSVSAAKAYAKKRRTEGFTLTQISQELADRGYTSRKTNKALTSPGMSRLVGKKRKARTAPKSKSGGGSPKAASSSLRIDLVRSIVAQKDRSADDRLALISLVLD